MTTLAGIAVLTLASGCSCVVKAPQKTETDMGSHHVVVKPGARLTSSSSSTGDDTTTYRFSCGDVSVTLENEQLTVNSTKYGKLRPGESVLIDGGKVLVAGRERQGTPMADQEVLASAPTREATAELAGHGVTVRPGSAFTTKTQILGRHTLTVGKATVVIKAGELFVNERPYGKLNAADTILVENDRVSVSGKIREPKQ